LAKTEAAQAGYDEAILMNSQGKVSEASGMNIFIVRNGVLITPASTKISWKGSPRDSVLTLARDLGIPTQERPVDKSELLIADEAFLTGTAAKITPIRQIEQYVLPPSPPHHRASCGRSRRQLPKIGIRPMPIG
jgi:branched-chain amino acid aminotransferase